MKLLLKVKNLSLADFSVANQPLKVTQAKHLLLPHEAVLLKVLLRAHQFQINLPHLAEIKNLHLLVKKKKKVKVEKIKIEMVAAK
jgi:hypothetical protein